MQMLFKITELPAARAEMWISRSILSLFANWLVLFLVCIQKMSKIEPIRVVYADSQTANQKPESEFNEFKPRLKSPQNRFQLSAGLNLERLNTILSGTNHIWAAA